MGYFILISLFSSRGAILFCENEAIQRPSHHLQRGEAVWWMRVLGGMPILATLYASNGALHKCQYSHN